MAAKFNFFPLGFGDYTPSKSFEGIDEPDAGGEEYIKLVFSTIYCAIGKTHTSQHLATLRNTL